MAKMKTTTSSKDSNYIKTTPIAIFWGKDKAKFRNLFFLALFLFLLGGCMVTEPMPKTTTTTTKVTTIKPTTTTTVCQVCPVYNATKETKELMICNAKVIDLENNNKNTSYYIKKLRTFRNQSDYYYKQINNTYTDLINYSKQNYTNVGNKSYWITRKECDARSKQRITSVITLFGATLVRIGGMSNR